MAHPISHGMMERNFFFFWVLMGGGLFLLNPVAPVGWLLGGFGGLLLPMGNCGARRTDFLATEDLRTVHKPILLVLVLGFT